MKTDAIKIIVFDLGEVLVKLDFSKVMALRHLGPQGLEQSIVSMNQWDIYDAFERGSLSEGEFLNQLNRQLSEKLTLDSFRAVWNSVLKQTVPGIPELLEKLSQQYPLFALTNSNETHIHYLKAQFPWVRFFHQVLTSYELGCRKPEPEIYEKLISLTQINAPQILFMDDRPENIDGARRCGISAELCQRPEEDLPRILKSYSVL
jgi:glucose-1-phosphatase